MLTRMHINKREGYNPFYDQLRDLLYAQVKRRATKSIRERLGSALDYTLWDLVEWPLSEPVLSPVIEDFEYAYENRH